MAQTSSTAGGKDLRVMLAENLNQVIPAAGNTTVLEIITLGLRRVGVEIVVGVNNLDQLIMNFKLHPNGSWIPHAAITATPGGLILFATGTLATQAVGTGAFTVNVEGIYAIQVVASGTVADTTTVTARASGS
jgi:hypothetical protein